tara:strand:+ start:3973 stop:5103 length:1131 start_codon:yes stop_codon:yes gene_type:complete
MSLTASGQISMHDIRSELGASGEISLIDASDGSIATINTNNASDDRPDGSAPHAMSEFYSYDHDAAGATSFGTWSDATIRFVGSSPGDGVTTHALSTNDMSDPTGNVGIDSNTDSGTVRGSCLVAISSTGDPGTASSSFGGGTSNSGSGYETIVNNSAIGSVSMSSSNDTINARFAFKPHAVHTETTTRTLTWTVNSVTNDDMTVFCSVTSFGGFCVGEYVPVNTQGGYKHISELEVGDSVMSYNFETNSVEEAPILKIEKPMHTDLVVYRFDDMDDIQYKHGNTVTINKGITITKDHPIYKEDGTMVCLDPAKAKELYGLDAQEIQKGDRIRFMDKIREVKDYLNSPEELQTYTILTKNNNFYAGGVLVHSEISE